MFLTHIINSFLLEAIFVCHVYTHAHAQMCQTSEAQQEKHSSTVREEYSRVKSKQEKENISGGLISMRSSRAAEHHSSSQPAPQESHLRGSEQVMLQPLLPGEEDQQKSVLCWGPSASGAIHTTN